jgi:hypothetical protein
MADADSNPEQDISLVGVSGVLPPGQGYTFAVECSDSNGAVVYP